jgi:hypothetical protein
MAQKTRFYALNMRSASKQREDSAIYAKRISTALMQSGSHLVVVSERR